MIIWLIGISGAGKTTIGKRLYNLKRNEKEAWVYLDGDELREVWGKTLGHSVEEREINARRISKLCKLLDDNDVNVIASVLSIFPHWQKWNRESFSSYFEIYVKADLNVVIERDTKGIYKSALNGKIKDVVGIDIEFPEPSSADLIVDTGLETQTPDRCVEQILSSLKAFNS